MTKMVVGLFPDLTAAKATAEDLITNDFGSEDISIVTNPDAAPAESEVRAASATTTAAKGAAAGGMMGGIAGLAAAAAALTVPGIGPVLAWGPLATVLAGAGIGVAAGGVIGALTNAGVPETDAQFYADGLGHGGALVTVRCRDTMAPKAAAIMGQRGVLGLDQRQVQYTEPVIPGADRRATASDAASVPAALREPARRNARVYDHPD